MQFRRRKGDKETRKRRRLLKKEESFIILLEEVNTKEGQSIILKDKREKLIYITFNRKQAKQEVRKNKLNLHSF